MPRDLYKKRLESLFSDARFPPAAPAPDAPAPAAPAVEQPAAIPAAEPAPAAEARPTEPSPGAPGERGAAGGKANGTAVAEAPSAPPLAPSAAATPARRVVTGLLGGGPSDADRFFELSQELLCIVGADGLFKRANPAFERVLGWSVRELTKMAFLDLVHPGDRPTTMAELEKLRQGATAVRVANRFQSANGSDRWISWIVQATGDGALYTTGHDITERRQAEDALRESEARYRSLIEDSHDAVVSVGLDGRFLFFSQVWLNLLGYTAEEMNRKTLFELMRADSLAQCQPLFLQVMGGHAVKQVETVFLTKRGDSVVLEANSTPRFQNGQVVATQTTFRDITARKQAEAELHKFRYALDRSTDAVFITDVQGVILYANQAFERTYGFSREETIGQTPRLIKSGLIPPEQYRVFWQTLQNKQVVAGELINRAKDGRLVPIDGANTPILDGAGQIIGFMAIHRDISERKQADAQLLLQAAALESAANAIVITDPAGLIQWVNPAFTVITGYTLDEVRGRSTRLLKSGLHDAAFYAEMWGVLLAGRTWRGEVTNRRKDGRLYVEDQIITPVTDAQGTIVNYVSTKEDITARKAAEQALRASQAELAEALRIAQLANWEYDVAADLFLFNDQFYALLRTTAEQEGGYTMPSARYAERFVPPEDAALVGEEIGKALTTTDPDYSAQLDHRIRYADGNEGYVTVRFRVVKDAQGRTVRTIGANQDITERKRAEAAVLAEQQRTQTVLETVSVPMIISRLADSRVLYANQALADIGRIALSELVGGRTVDYFADPADRDKVAAGLQRQGQVSNFETQLRRGDGTLYWALLTSRILMYQGERCVLTTYIDITERKAAEAEALTHTAELEALNRLGQAITEEHDFPRLLRRAGDLIMQVFEARSGFIALYDPATGRMEWPYFLDAGTYVEVAPRRLGQGPTSYVIQERRPLLINQDLAARMAELGAYYSGGPEEETARAWLGVPIFVDEAVAGVISVSQPHEQAFDDDDVRLLTTVAASLGAGLQTVRLLEQVRRRVAELAVLNAIVGAAAASLDVTRTLDVAAREVAQLIQARSCGVALLDAAGQTLTVVADHGVLDEPRSVGVVIPVPGNLSSERAIATRQAVVIADAQTDPLTEPIHELMRARQTYALAIVPLLVRQTVIGTIALDSNDPQRQFTPAEVGFLETVARQLAGAI
ncbi:MAG: PAS domain S-box protein, partial [Anaerolineales bacterium]|nr:PAS domain S-box protein [Anaerolineales bacterium]